MVLAVRILAGLLLIWIFVVVVGHKAVPLEGRTTCNRAGNPLVPTSGLIHFREWPISASTHLFANSGAEADSSRSPLRGRKRTHRGSRTDRDARFIARAPHRTVLARMQDREISGPAASNARIACQATSHRASLGRPSRRVDNHPTS